MVKTVVETFKSERANAQRRTPLSKSLKILSAIFAVNIAITLVYLIFSSRDLIQYNPTNLIDWLNLVFEAVVLWMIWYRLKVTRQFALVFTVFNVVVGTIAQIVTGNFDFIVQSVSIIPDVAIFCYFYFSKSVPRILDQDLSMDIEEQPLVGQGAARWTWPFVRNLIIYFCVFSFLGHWMEMGFCMAIRAGLVGGEYDPSNTMLWRDWFYPFPMHGMAVVLIGVLLYPLWQWLLKKTNLLVGSLLSLIINGLACGTIEFVCGQMWNANLENWDYSNMPFNIMGQVCLQNVVGFALAASLIAWFVYPWLESTLAKLPANVMNITFVVVGVAFLVAQTLYLVVPPIDYRTEIEYALAQDDANPGYLRDDQREEYERDLAYLNYLDEYRAENQERLQRERAEAAANKG